MEVHDLRTGHPTTVHANGAAATISMRARFAFVAHVRDLLDRDQHLAQLRDAPRLEARGTPPLLF